MMDETIMYPKEVKANKTHICNYCGLNINAGDVYLRAVYKGDEVYQWRCHIHCELLTHKLDMFSDCDDGLTSDDFKTHINEWYMQKYPEKYDEATWEEIIETAKEVLIDGN